MTMFAGKFYADAGSIFSEVTRKKVFGRKRSSRSTFSFVSDVKVDTKSINKAFVKPTAELMKRINKESPSIIRQAMKDALAADDGLKAYAKMITPDLFPGEKRPMGIPKAGSGVGVKISNGRFVIHMQLFSKKAKDAFGRDGFYTFQTLSVGREGFGFIPKHKKGLYVIRVSKDTPSDSKTFPATGDNEYENIVEPNRREDRVTIHRAGGTVNVPPVSAPSNPWMEVAAKNAIKIAKKRFGT